MTIGTAITSYTKAYDMSVHSVLHDYYALILFLILQGDLTHETHFP